jgi:hypothetical protein
MADTSKTSHRYSHLPAAADQSIITKFTRLAAPNLEEDRASAIDPGNN